MCMLVYSTGIVQTELISGYASIVHTSSSFCPHTHILIPFEDHEPTGLKVDIAGVGPLWTKGAESWECPEGALGSFATWGENEFL